MTFFFTVSLTMMVGISLESVFKRAKGALRKKTKPIFNGYPNIKIYFDFILLDQKLFFVYSYTLFFL